jgi:hypothetical protein
MKKTHRILIGMFLAGGLASTHASCVTATEVKSIVAASNAALVSPRLLQGDETPDDSWKEAVRRIDELIAKHPDQTTLVNTLRVRQAMLLTAYKRFALAKQAWGLAGTEGLNARDKALRTLSDDLLWWFENAAVTFDKTRIIRAKTARANIDNQTKAMAIGSDIRCYLEVMRATMVAKAANKSLINSAGKKKAAEAMFAEGANHLVLGFDESDHEWVQANAKSTHASGDIPIARLRARVWLRDVLKKYRELAAGRPALTISWDPPWIGKLVFQ